MTQVYLSRRRLTLLTQAFGLADGRCQACGAEEGLPHPATGTTVRLHVGPIGETVDPFLRALCQRCAAVTDERGG